MVQSEEPEVGGIWPEVEGKPLPHVIVILINVGVNNSIMLKGCFIHCYAILCGIRTMIKNREGKISHSINQHDGTHLGHIGQ